MDKKTLLREQFPVNINVLVRYYDKDHHLRSQYASHNLIVLVAREKISAMLRGAESDYISIIKIGKGGAPPGDLFNPTSPEDADTGLYSPIAAEGSARTLQPEEIEAVTTTTTRYTCIFFAEDIDEYVNEAILTFTDEVCFARHTFPSQPLFAEFNGSLEIIWDVECKSLLYV
jgi:hypothetical protein